ncbi:hypothetical protein KGF57_004852 [Candida theae]|uniref:Major facilitator superfamily (MFS) profile domain-containing protein n=1 Tax=Candida theae TaxID=1198502 RepID=A0AAD5BBG5_9ASCO|nr:uncharacterized protein KGF57_004852 [Candida theae]KAI5949253.1 hypothetical protein KGF57_004852 [Candida theae]
MTKSQSDEEKVTTPEPNVQLDTTPTLLATSNESKTSTTSNGLHLLDDPSNFPSGLHTKAVLTVIGSFLGLTGALGFVNSAGVIQSYVSEHSLKDEPSTAISWIFSLYNFFAFGGTLVSGPVFDKFGCKGPIMCGGIAMFLGLLATSFCHRVWQFILAYGFLAGIGAAFTFGPFVGVISHWYCTKRAIALGLAYSGGGLGGVIFPLLFRSLFPEIGFGWSIRVGAFLSLFLLAVGWLMVTDRKEEFSDVGNGSVLKEMFHSIDFKIVYRNPLFGVIVGGLLFNGLAFLISMVEIPLYATNRGFSDSDAYLLVVVFNSFSIPGRIVPSIIADKWLGRFNTFCVINCFSLLIFCVIWIPFGHYLPAMYVFSGCFGFSSGSVLSLSASLVASIVKTSDVGKGLGTAFFVLSFGDLVGLPIGSAIATGSHASFDNLVYFLTCCAFIGTVVSFVSRYMYGGFILKRM